MKLQDQQSIPGTTDAEQQGAQEKPQSVPPAVRHHVLFALNKLREQEQALAGVQRARGNGHNLALELRDRQPKIDQAQAKLQEFRELAPKNGVDAEAYISGLGGEPDFERFGGPAPAEPVESRYPILDINGKLFCDIRDQLSADHQGFYAKQPNGIHFYGRDKEPFAFAVNNSGQARFFVTCSRHGQQIRYMFSTCSIDERRLGIEGLGAADEHDLITKLLDQLQSSPAREMLQA